MFDNGNIPIVPWIQQGQMPMKILNPNTMLPSIFKLNNSLPIKTISILFNIANDDYQRITIRLASTAKSITNQKVKI